MESANENVADKLQMAHEVRSLGNWSMGWGVLNLILSALSSPFGLVLIAAGLLAHVLDTAAMFVVFGIVFLWAAITNLFVDGLLSSAFTIALVISAVQTFRSYRRYRPVEAGLIAGEDGDEEEQTIPAGAIRGDRFLPWLSFLTALISLGSFLAIFLLMSIWFMMTGTEEPPLLIVFAGSSLLELGVLALALGLAAILSHYRYKGLSIVGILGGAAAVVITILLSV
jgi:hypothetical protein